MNFLVVKLCSILACYFCCHSCWAMLFGMKLCYFIFLHEFAPVPLVLRTSSSFSPVLKGDTEILCDILVCHLLCDTWTSASCSTHLWLTAYWDLIAIAYGMMTAPWCYCHWCCIMKSSPVCCSNCSNRLPTCFMATAVEGWLMLFNVSSCWRTWRIACGSVSFSKIKAKECYKNSKGCFS